MDHYPRVRSLTTGASLSGPPRSGCGDSYPERGGRGPRIGAGPCPLACEGSLAEDIHCASIRYPSYMTKRLIEVDDDKLAQARALLGTSTLKATVDAALDELLALDRRRRALLAEHGITDDLLADPSRRQAAWR